jgi:hypothetical protein
MGKVRREYIRMKLNQLVPIEEAGGPTAYTVDYYDTSGDGLFDALQSVSNLARSAGSTPFNAAKCIGNNALIPAAKYAGKHADYWAFSLMNAASNAIAAVNYMSPISIEPHSRRHLRFDLER